MSFTRGKKRSVSRKSSSSKPVYVPKSYQKECIRFGVSKPAAGFLLAPGLGKTSIILFIFKLLKKLGHVDHLFVLSKKKIIYYVWKQEIKKWGLPFTSTILHGGEKNKRLKQDHDVYLMNFEGLSWLTEKFKVNKRDDNGKLRRNVKGEVMKRTIDRAKRFFEGKRVMFVADESSKLRNTNTVRFKKLKQILPYFVRRYILTGSPAPKGLMNLFGQIYVLDMGQSLGAYITHFRNTYFQPAGPLGRDWALQPGAEKRIFKAIRPLILRYGHDQLDMPPISFIDKVVRLPKKQRKIYDEMEREFIIQLKGHEITAANAAVASGKCRQIANGGLYYDSQGEPTALEKKARKWKRVHDEKCEALVDLLDELEGEPALVAFEYGHDRHRLEAYFKKHAPQYKGLPFVDGKTKEKDVDRYLKQWDRGELPAIFCQTGTVAHGLNLQGKGGIVIYFALTWSLEDYEQFYQRVWRQGQTRRVLVYRLIVKDTVDEVVKFTLRGHDINQQKFLKAMEKRYGFR